MQAESPIGSTLLIANVTRTDRAQQNAGLRIGPSSLKLSRDLLRSLPRAFGFFLFSLLLFLKSYAPENIP
jgi:hypothetical protein